MVLVTTIQALAVIISNGHPGMKSTLAAHGRQDSDQTFARRRTFCDVEMHGDCAMYHIVSRVQSGGGAAYLFSVAGRIACKDASLCDAFSGPWTSSLTVYKLHKSLNYKLSDS